MYFRRKRLKERGIYSRHCDSFFYYLLMRIIENIVSLLHPGSGKVSFSAQKIRENLRIVLDVRVSTLSSVICLE